MKRALFLFAISLAATGCSTGGGGAGTVGGGHMVPALVGSWYAGAGGTSVPYDPSTGTYGTPNGSGLVYTFRGDGSYTKAFQSYQSAGGCTTGFTAFEDGAANAGDASIELLPRSGHVKYSDTCAPSLDSDKPEGNLQSELFDWSLGPDPDALRLTDMQGSSSLFRRL